MTTTAATSGTAASALPAIGGSSSSTLSDWAGPYVTTMLGQAQAVANQPYQVYQGPLTAGPSSVQQNLFSGIGGLTLPQNLGQSWTNTGAPALPSAATNVPSETSLISQAGQGQTAGFGQPAQLDTSGTSMAAQYMNPYLQQSLQPQLNQLAYTAGINEQGDLSKLTQAGAYGGSRQAVMQGIDQGNLLAQQAAQIGQGYNTAYNQALSQYNQEQANANTLANTMNTIGQTQQGINQAGVTADYNEFLNQRNYPMTQLQFEQSMLQGLPISTVTNTPTQQTGIQALSSAVGGLGSLATNLSNLGIKLS